MNSTNQRVIIYAYAGRTRFNAILQDPNIGQAAFTTSPESLAKTLDEWMGFGRAKNDGELGIAIPRWGSYEIQRQCSFEVMEMMMNANSSRYCVDEPFCVAYLTRALHSAFSRDEMYDEEVFGELPTRVKLSVLDRVEAAVSRFHEPASNLRDAVVSLVSKLTPPSLLLTVQFNRLMMERERFPPKFAIDVSF